MPCVDDAPTSEAQGIFIKKRGGIGVNYADEIKQNVTMREICEMYGIAVSRGGFALCPFHADKKPSLKVYDGKRGFCCFVCDTKGSVIDFVMRFFGLDFKAAACKINTDFNLGLPIGEKQTAEERRIAHNMSVLLRAERERKRRQQEQLENEYHAALDEFIRLDRIAIAHKPHSDGVISPEYAAAVKDMAAVKYRLECAEIALKRQEENTE